MFLFEYCLVLLLLFSWKPILGGEIYCGSDFTVLATPVTALRRTPGYAGHTNTETVSYENGRYLSPNPGNPGVIPTLTPEKGKSAIIDVELGSVGTVYEGTQKAYRDYRYGNVDVKKAIANLATHKNWNDGTLDVFIPMLPDAIEGDPQLENYIPRAFYEVRMFGAKKSLKDRAEPQVKKQNRRERAKRAIRIFLVGENGRTLSQTPQVYLGMGSQMAKEFGVPVAVTNHVVGIGKDGEIRSASGATGSPWVLFSPE